MKGYARIEPKKQKIKPFKGPKDKLNRRAGEPQLHFYDINKEQQVQRKIAEVQKKIQVVLNKINQEINYMYSKEK